MEEEDMNEEKRRIDVWGRLEKRVKGKDAR